MTDGGEPSQNPKPFLKRGTGTAKYKITYPVMQKAGLQSNVNNRTGDERNQPHQEMHYASSPVRPRPLQPRNVISEIETIKTRYTAPTRLDLRSLHNHVSNSYAESESERHQLHPPSTRVRTDSGRGQDSSDSDRSSSGRRQFGIHIHERANSNSPEYIPTSSRTVHTADSGCADDISAGVSPDADERICESRAVTVVSVLDDVTRDPNYDLVHDRMSLSKVDHPHMDHDASYLTSRSGRQQLVDSFTYNATKQSHLEDSASEKEEASRSLLSFRHHERILDAVPKRKEPTAQSLVPVIEKPPAREDPSSTPDTLSDASAFSEQTRQCRERAKNMRKFTQEEAPAGSRVPKIAGPVPSMLSEAKAAPRDKFEDRIGADVPSLAHTSIGVSPISSIRGDGTVNGLSSGSSSVRAPSEESDHFAQRFLGTRRPLDDVVPPLFGPREQREPLNVKPSEATLPRHRDTVAARNQVDLSTPATRNATGQRLLRQRNEAPQETFDQIGRTTKPAVHFEDWDHEQRSSPTVQNLILQLRDTIVNFDFAEAQWRKQQREMQAELQAARAELENEREEWLERKKGDEERIQRDWKSIERERKSMKKGDVEREKERQEQFDDQRKLISRLQQQLTDARIKENKREKAFETQKTELEKTQKTKERLEKRVGALQKEVATLRGKAAAEKMQLEAEQRAQIRRVQKPGLLRAKNRTQSLPNTTVVEERPSSKNVTWADYDDGASETDSQTNSMDQTTRILAERGAGLFGPLRLYKSEGGEWTKATNTPCGCSFYEYNNGDTRWTARDRGLEVYYYASMGATVLELPSRIIVRHFSNKQFEIFRPSGEVTLVSPNGRRTETMRMADSSFYVEIFELLCGNYFCTVIDDNRKEKRLLGNAEKPITTSTRAGGSFCRILGDGALEFLESGMAIWYHNGDCKISLDAMGVQISLLATNDEGVVKHVKVVGAQKVKSLCASWGRSMRQHNRNLASGASATFGDVTLGSVCNISSLL